MFAIAVHGGAGSWRGEPEARALEGVVRAAAAARKCAAAGAGALDAAVAAVRVLEDDPTFNAGTGSVLNRDGEVEMDAAVMSSGGLRCGGVGALARTRNPVLVARAVMEQTDHVLLVGEGALRFARAAGFGDHEPRTARRRRQWEARRQGQAADGPGGTVGAVVRDRSGALAAATSTGGRLMKLPGRVGDSALPGAGNYATPAAAVSATGHGELMMRVLSAKAVCDAVAGGHPVAEALAQVLRQMQQRVGSEVGLIAVDAAGHIAARQLTPAMPWAWVREGEGAIGRAMAG